MLRTVLGSIAAVVAGSVVVAAARNAFWPDRGSETARYGDKIICGYRAWPRLVALGAGWRVRG